MKWCSFLFGSALLFSGCSTVPTKTNETLSQGVYATASAADAGRFDLADRYAHEVTRLVPPPKKPISIHALTNPPSAILPERFKESPVIVENSAQYQALVSNNAALQKQLTQEHKDAVGYINRVGEILRSQQDTIARLQAENLKLKATQKPWYKSINFLGIIGLAVAFFGNPLGFIVGFAVKLLIGIVIAFLLVKLTLYLWHRYSHR